jgi:hypothetical protein
VEPTGPAPAVSSMITSIAAGGHRPRRWPHLRRCRPSRAAP